MNKEIIVLTVHFSNGGAERVLSELIKEWSRTGQKVTLVQMRGDSYDTNYSLPKSVRVINMKTNSSSRFFRRFGYMKEMLAIVRKHPNATVLSFVNPAILILGMCKPFIRNKVVFSERCAPAQSPPNPMLRKVRDLIYNVADQCVFQTQEAKEHFSKRVQKRGVVIPNPINDNLPEISACPRQKRVLAVCQLIPQKNVKMMIEAFEMFHKEFPEYFLEIYGRGEQEAMLKDMIASKSLSDCVFLKGFSDNIFDIMNDSVMYVSSSDYEGISNSMLEALGMGLPSVVTDCPIGGARLTIKSGENGILVPVGSAKKMYLGMKKIAGDPAFAKKLSENAVKIREQLPVEKIAARWLEVM